jgi:hypothetical protein
MRRHRHSLLLLTAKARRPKQPFHDRAVLTASTVEYASRPLSVTLGMLRPRGRPEAFARGAYRVQNHAPYAPEFPRRIIESGYGGVISSGRLARLNPQCSPSETEVPRPIAAKGAGARSRLVLEAPALVVDLDGIGEDTEVGAAEFGATKGAARSARPQISLVQLDGGLHAHSPGLVEVGADEGELMIRSGRRRLRPQEGTLTPYFSVGMNAGVAFL